MSELAHTEEPRRSKSGRVVGAALLVVVALIVSALFDLWLTRPAWQRSFLVRDLECLRCHTEMLPRMEDSSLHQPFASRHCTSCHTNHSQQRTIYLTKTGAAGTRVRAVLEAFALGSVWDLLEATGLVQESSPSTSTLPGGTTSGTAPGLTADESVLCWQCHGNLGSKKFEAVVHPPFAAGHCTSCHDPHSSHDRPLLRGATSDVCVSCHAISGELLAADVHAPFAHRQCTSCHDPHASMFRGLLPTRQRELCLGCHATVAASLSDPVRHGPAESGDCTACHRPHSARFGQLLAAPAPVLCYGCHDVTRQEFASRVHHPLGSRLQCPDCHAPHASRVRGLLPTSQRALCLGCHSKVRAELDRPHPHRPALHGDCTQCHSPHGSSASAMLHKSMPELCYPCHPGSRPRRRVAAAGDCPTVRGKDSGAVAQGRSAEVVRHLVASRTGGWRMRVGVSGRESVGSPLIRVQSDQEAVRPGGRDIITEPYLDAVPSEQASPHPMGGESGVRCTSCHEPHASEEPNLLNASSKTLCLTCHSLNVPEFSSGAHGSLDCVRCHNIHDVRYAGLLSNSNPELCYECHSLFDDPVHFHPASPSYYDTHSERPLTCTSTCHNPHGTTNPYMLRVPYGTSGKGTDYLCLLCHTKVGLEY